MAEMKPAIWVRPDCGKTGIAHLDAKRPPGWPGATGYFTADQLAQARREERARCITACESKTLSVSMGEADQSYDEAVMNCADAIRDLPDEVDT